MSDLLRSTVLILLSEQEGHGYDLRARMAKAGVPTNTSTGTLYRALILMAEEGLVESSWDAPDKGPARRVYSITTSGRTYLDNELADIGNWGDSDKQEADRQPS
jgi:DNA-binding PadR family transcriptional regulator